MVEVHDTGTGNFAAQEIGRYETKLLPDALAVPSENAHMTVRRSMANQTTVTCPIIGYISSTRVFLTCGSLWKTN